MKFERLEPRYLTQFPDQLQEGILYISEEFNLTAHKCCCGCREDVYLKLGPAKWRLAKEGDGSVSLYPSVGNWKYACRSHYWIISNEVREAGPMSTRTIESVQERDREDRQRYIVERNAQSKRQHEKPLSRWRRAKVALEDVYRRIKRRVRGL